jgi:hypothetical protein
LQWVGARKKSILIEGINRSKKIKYCGGLVQGKNQYSEGINICKTLIEG